MSKYQKLDSERPTHVDVVDDDNDDEHDDDDDDERLVSNGDEYDESFSLYFDDKYKNKSKAASSSSYNNNNNNNNNECNINDYKDNSNNIATNHNHSASHNSNSTNLNSNHLNSTNLMLDFEEHTMEVPLLRSNSSTNLHDYEPTAGYSSADDCRCAQPGFGANIKCKTAQEAKCKMLLAISLCCVFMIIEFLGGYVAGSLAIMTDAAHLASDCISFIIGLVAIWLGSRPPDKRMSFGYKRLEVLGALGSILGIWLLTATLVLVATQRIYTNEYDLDADTMMTISGIGILINIAMIFILHGSWFIPSGALGHGHGHGHSHAHEHMAALTDTTDTELKTTTTTMNTTTTSATTVIMPNINSVGQNGLKPLQTQTSNEHRHSHRHSDSHSRGHNHSHGGQKSERNLNLRAAMIHVIGDLVQSIGVFLAAILIKFCPSAKYADPLCTLLFSVIVVLTTVRLFKESLGILLDAVPHDISLHELEMDLTSIEGVKSVHHLNVWSHMSSHSVMMAHLVVDLLTDSNVVLDKATRLATSSKYNIKHVTIQIERLLA